MIVKKLAALFIILGFGLSVWAQPEIDFVPKVLNASALGRQVAAETLSKLPAVYHPVFGYIPLENVSQATKTVYAVSEQLPTESDDFIQVAPILHPALEKAPFIASFDEGIYIGHEHNKLAQAVYLWRLAHPHKLLRENPYLFEMAREVVKRNLPSGGVFIIGFDEGMDGTWELPNYLFLKRMLGTVTPTSYAKLYEITPFYPKHVTLNDYGFPVKTAQEESNGLPFQTVDDAYANMLDNYLMLSNPNEMGAFNNAGRYTPFVLTKEEHAAADKLLQLRRQGEKLPANPTERDLLELAYNRLETHTVPYTQIALVSDLYKAYPNYKNTRLYRAIKGKIRGQFPVESYDHGYAQLENMDMAHLIVLDAVMGGVEPDNLSDVRRALDAFEKLCADIHPKNEQAIAHLLILQQNLRLVFDPLIRFNEQLPNWITSESPEWEKSELGGRAYSLLVVRSMRDLIGRNWTLH